MTGPTDIALIDFDKVQDYADRKQGMQSLPSTGIRYVIVNGIVVVKDSVVLEGVPPGQPIRNAELG